MSKKLAVCDKYRDEITGAFEHGDIVTIQSYMETFYDRVLRQNPSLEVYGIENCGDRVSFWLQSDRSRFVLHWLGTKKGFRIGRARVTDARAAEILRVPVAFLEGMLLAARCQIELGFDDERELLRKERQQFDRDRKLSIRSALKSYRRQIESTLAPRRFTSRTARICNGWNMPPVPNPFMEREHLQLEKPFSGIYFEWEGMECTYVGKSKNVPSRVGKSHHKLKGNRMMSFLKFPSEELGRNECFYIWLLDPRKNGSKK